VSVLLYLMPAALLLGLLGLAAFLWALKSGQFEDLDGAAHRILIDEDPGCAEEGLSLPANLRRSDRAGPPY
jgi:cbb3-type cytochrome oxidase maturation protein